MKSFVLLTNSVSPHQLPLSEILSRKFGKESFTYIYTKQINAMRKKMGWNKITQNDINIRCSSSDCYETRNAGILLSGCLDAELFKYRLDNKKSTYYMSERWYKPKLGMIRLLFPKYMCQAKNIIKLFEYESFTYLPISVHSAIDMLRLYFLFQGKISYLFKRPIVAFESRPGGSIFPFEQVESVLDEQSIKFALRYGFVQIPECHWGKFQPYGIFKKMKLWGYYVQNSKNESICIDREKDSVLWVGRMDSLKNLPTLIKVCIKQKKKLDIYGHGKDEEIARKIAEGSSYIHFHDYVPIEEVRYLMRSHDIYVLCSNGYEGWGAVVSEALCEGMKVIGTVDAGSSSTILPINQLYMTNDLKSLDDLLNKNIPNIGIGHWTAEDAAQIFE